MKLDRNINPDGANKYAFLSIRKLREKIATSGEDTRNKIINAIDFLESQGVCSSGNTPQTEFFLIMLKDEFAEDALEAYARAAERKAIELGGVDSKDGPGLFEYANDVMRLAETARNHPLRKLPD